MSQKISRLHSPLFISLPEAQPESPVHQVDSGGACETDGYTLSGGELTPMAFVRNMGYDEASDGITVSWTLREPTFARLLRRLLAPDSLLLRLSHQPRIHHRFIPSLKVTLCSNYSKPSASNFKLPRLSRSGNAKLKLE